MTRIGKPFEIGIAVPNPQIIPIREPQKELPRPVEKPIPIKEPAHV